MKKKTRNTVLALVIAALAVIIAAVPFARHAAADEAEDSVLSIRETVMQRALQCYVIEGAYPMSLDYLEDNYGLTVNTRDYLIVYTPYAENLPPDVRVVSRHAEEER